MELTSTADAESRAFGSACTVEPYQWYCFSAYVKSAGATGYITIQDATTYALSEGQDFKDPNLGWQRLKTFYYNNNPYSVTVNPCLILNTTGTVYLDGVQMEKAEAPSRLNLVHNGDFTHEASSPSAAEPVYGWTSTTLTASDGRVITSAGAPATQLDGAVLQMYGDPQAAKELTTNLSIAGSEGDSFVLTGWAWANSVPIPDGETNRAFNITVTLNHYDGTNTTAAAEFNPDCDDWQYAATAVVATQAFESVTITLKYNYNANDVYFDGIQLYKEPFGASYAYDADGNVKSVTDIKNQNTTYEYQNNDLTKIIQNGTAKMTYEYDSYHNVTKATTAAGEVYEFTYDTYGNNTQVKITSGGKTISSSATYENDGNTLASTTDALGKTSRYSYNPDTNVLVWSQYPEDTDATWTHYYYDTMLRPTNVTGFMNQGTDRDMYVNYAYTGKGQLHTISTVGATYRFTYGNFGLRTKFSIDGHTNTDGKDDIVTYNYTNDRNHYLQSLVYGNKDWVSYNYDNKGRLTSQSYETGYGVNYYYNNNGLLAEVHDGETDITQNFTYNNINELVHYEETGGPNSLVVRYTYNSLGNLSQLEEVINGQYRLSEYAYDANDRVYSMYQCDSGRVYTYDSFGRLSNKASRNVGTEMLWHSYFYNDPSDTTTSSQIGTHVVATNSSYKSYSYTYDGNGNITSITCTDAYTNTTTKTSYAYDSQNQLIRENNQAGNYTHVWIYDRVGNLLYRVDYPYTEGALGTATGSVEYGYNTTGWKDLLTSYNGRTITYDGIGNMTSDGLRTYTWKHGRELATLTQNNVTWTNTYNADGLRIKREGSNDNDYTYTYVDGRLVRMTYNNDEVLITYDADGTPLAIKFWSIWYYYVTNLQGDVVAITDLSGQVVVTYTYDAWGKALTIGGSMAYTLGDYNPLRYRGYVYDEETDLYYLQSRYYDPEIGRFVSGDGFVSTGQGINGNNMFAYCGNNPIIRVDPSGLFWTELWNELTQSIQDSIAYYSAALALSQTDTPAPGPADLAAVSLILGGLIYHTTLAVYNTISAPISPSFDYHQSITDGLSSIASSFENYECNEAANSMRDYLKEHSKNGAVVTITFVGGKGYIWSDIKGATISENGIHVGIEYNGIVYCNVHPLGLPAIQWVEDFHATGTKFVTKTPF